MEELLLETLFAFHELDVVNQENINFSISTLERCGGVGSNCIDVFVQERFGRDIPHLVMRVMVMHICADGMQKVGLAESRRAVNEKRVV